MGVFCFSNEMYWCWKVSNFLSLFPCFSLPNQQSMQRKKMFLVLLLCFFCCWSSNFKLVFFVVMRFTWSSLILGLVTKFERIKNGIFPFWISEFSGLKSFGIWAYCYILNVHNFTLHHSLNILALFNVRLCNSLLVFSAMSMEICAC